MDQWKAAFKLIFGKTPTKSDCSVAPSAIRATLPITPEKQRRLTHSSTVGRKRKHLVVKPNELKDEEFCCSPPKRPSKTLSSSPFGCLPQKFTNEMAECSTSSSTASSSSLQLLRPAIDPFLSPVKNWQDFLASPTQSARKRQRNLMGIHAALLKTPSPAKLLRRPITCINIGNLLTPEKAMKCSLEEEDEEEEEAQSEPDGYEEKLANAMNGDRENEEAREEEKPEGSHLGQKAAKKENKKPQRKTRKTTKPKANYVPLNLRRRQYAPISKFRGNKKWKGKKGGGDWNNRRRGLFGGGGGRR